MFRRDFGAGGSERQIFAELVAQEVLKDSFCRNCGARGFERLFSEEIVGQGLLRNSFRRNCQHDTPRAFQAKLNSKLFCLGTAKLDLGKRNRPANPLPHSILKRLILDIHIVVLEQHERCMQAWECM